MMSSQEAADTVRRFLEALEDRDLEAASSMLAPGASIVFPGARPFADLNEIVAWARQRYQWVRKTIERIDSVSLGEGEIVVYVSGQLYGVNLNGVEFAGVRFIDRFSLRDGLILSQEVWNDLAETKVLDLKEG